MLALCVITISLIAGAQGTPVFGVKAGMNISGVKTNWFDPSVKIGAHGGVFVDIPVASGFHITPEALFSAEGSKVTNSNAKVNLGFINIPVMFQYHTPGGFYGETGPQLGFLISAKASENGQKEDWKNYLKSTNLSWAFGFGYKLPVAGLGVGARYTLGLSNLDKEPAGSGIIKANDIQISISKSFGL